MLLNPGVKFGQNVYEKVDSSIQDTEILYRLTHKDIVMTYFRRFKSVQIIN